ncbi:MAG TPA: LysR substrate-binding domain-containing protein [Methylomirabilota bacterium]|jgi:aminoethylphosphonate catabolism LysR family transcriptional regulator|nr:LysR substrate-binding domain-containing protein [Methylomirabilota bacterium]
MLGFSQLRAFEAVTRTGSFTRAAERLRVTIPAVSLQIRQLERDHDVRLFDRIGRRVRLTPAGEALRQYAERIFTLTHDAERALQGAGDFRGTRLRVAATPTTAGYYLAGFWKRLRRRYPGLQLEVSVHNTRVVRQRLLALEDDLGVLGGATEDSELIVRPFARDRMVAIVAREHPWARRRSVALKALGGQPLILREPGSAGREIVERALRRAGIEPRAMMEVTSTEAIKQAVEANGGVGILARAAVQRDVAGGHLRAVSVRGGDLGLTLAFAYHRERADSPLLRAVLDVIAPRRSR